MHDSLLATYSTRLNEYNKTHPSNFIWQYASCRLFVAVVPVSLGFRWHHRRIDSFQSVIVFLLLFLPIFYSIALLSLHFSLLQFFPVLCYCFYYCYRCQRRLFFDATNGSITVKSFCSLAFLFFFFFLLYLTPICDLPLRVLWMQQVYKVLF